MNTPSQQRAGPHPYATQFGEEDVRARPVPAVRNGGRDAVTQYAERFGVEFFPGGGPWVVPCNAALSCAIPGAAEAALDQSAA